MKERILSSLLTVLALSYLQAQTAVIPPVPRLVVGVTIDQLRTDYLEAFSVLYGEKGFKRLWKEGRVYNNVEYNFSPIDPASALASIYTGTSPSKNGITGNLWLDRSTLRVVTCVDDKDYVGVFTVENTSLKNLQVSTLTDELKVATQGRSIVYSISPRREEAVIAAGHAGNGAYWLNDLTGKWCSSSYYGKVPPRWLMVYNENASVDKRIDEIIWKPLYSLDVYDNSSDNGGFKYSFSDTRKYRSLKVSPCVNEEVNRLVEACLYGTMLGADPVTDFLAIGYNAGSYQRESGEFSFIEMQDTYARLDNDIANLLDLIDKKVGLQNTLFFITSTGYIDNPVAEDASYRIPTGDFYMNRAVALLNMYLMAVYGEGQYVEAYNGLQIYLDHKLIEKKQLRLKDVLERCSEFLTDLSGVQRVYTSYDLTLGTWSPILDRVRNAFYSRTSGDILLEVCAGWKLKDADSRDITTVRQAHVNFPLFFYGTGINAGHINSSITTEYIAPTLALLMRIRAPNACTSFPIEGIR